LQKYNTKNLILSQLIHLLEYSTNEK